MAYQSGKPMAYEYLGESLLRGAESEKDEMLRPVQPQNVPGGHWDDPDTDEIETRPGWGLGTAEEDSFLRTAPSASDPNAFNMNEWETRRVREQSDRTLAKVAEETSRLDYWKGVAQDTKAAYDIGEALFSVATSRGKDEFTSAAGRAAGQILTSRPVREGISELTGASDTVTGGVAGGISRMGQGLAAGEDPAKAVAGGVFETAADIGGRALGAIVSEGNPWVAEGFAAAGRKGAQMLTGLLPGSKKKTNGFSTNMGRAGLLSAAELLKGRV